MTRRWLVVVGALFVLAAFSGPLAIALSAERGEATFGDNETLGLNELESASVIIEVGKNSVSIDTDAMAPGDRLLGRVELQNRGTLPLRYAMVAELEDGEGGLLGVLEWTIWSSTAQECRTPGELVLFEGSITVPRVLGDPAMGPDTGDRQIEPGAEDVLCIEAALPIDLTNEHQGAAARVDLTVQAEQAIEASP